MLSLTQRLLHAIAVGNWEDYQMLCDDSLTGTRLHRIKACCCEPARSAGDSKVPASEAEASASVVKACG